MAVGAGEGAVVWRYRRCKLPSNTKFGSGEKCMRPLEFGWYLPTHGDTTAYGLASAQIAGSVELCERVVAAAEKAGFEYLLIPVGSTCWEAWISGGLLAAASSTIHPFFTP